MNNIQATAAQTTPAIQSIGVWMAGILIAYILFNVVRSTLNPTAFAESFGIPLTDPNNTAFVFVYGIRSLFLGVFGLALLLSRNYQGLALFALVATVMPVLDAVLVAQQGGPTTTVLRHVATAGFLLLTWFFLNRWLHS